jgi:hypothetical protein
VKKRYFLKSSSFSCALFLTSLFLTSNALANPLKVYRVPKSNTTKLYIYKNPTVHSNTIKKLPGNTRWIVRLPGVKKYSGHNTWFQVSCDGKKGWMKKSLLIFDASATNMATKDPECLLNKTRKKICNNPI